MNSPMSKTTKGIQKWTSVRMDFHMDFGNVSSLGGLLSAPCSNKNGTAASVTMGNYPLPLSLLSRPMPGQRASAGQTPDKGLLDVIEKSISGSAVPLCGRRTWITRNPLPCHPIRRHKERIGIHILSFAALGCGAPGIFAAPPFFLILQKPFRSGSRMEFSSMEPDG